MGRMIYFSEDPGIKPLVLQHSKMEGVKWFKYGVNDGYNDLYFFCRDTLERPWKPAEELLIGDPGWAGMYARWIMKKRWLKAESVIKTDSYWWPEYCRTFNLET